MRALARITVSLGLLAATLAITPAASAAPCAGFTDVDTADFYCADVTWVKSRGITLGCTGTTYCPGDAVSRVQMALFLRRALKQFGEDTSDAQPAGGAPCTLGEVSLTIAIYGHGQPADGRLLKISDYLPLFTIVGTRYGGDGAANFALPDLRSAAPSGTTYMVCVTGTWPAPG